MIKFLQREIQYFGVQKNRRLDFYLQTLISNQTGFKVNKIYINYAEKYNSNEFNVFEFEYKRKVFSLINGRLKELI